MPHIIPTENILRHLYLSFFPVHHTHKLYLVVVCRQLILEVHIVLVEVRILLVVEGRILPVVAVHTAVVGRGCILGVVAPVDMPRIQEGHLDKTVVVVDKGMPFYDRVITS